MAAQAPSFWHRRGVAAAFLWPLSLLFCLVAAMRRKLYRAGLLETVRVSRPVIVVGNISVGGSGKTPVVAWLAAQLKASGLQAGIISRGYGGTLNGIYPVQATSDADVAGDEPVLLARLTGCPVIVGKDRPAAAAALIRTHPECDVVISDDGLQHYRLHREVEIVVVDEHTLGNKWCLPAGPLREKTGRLVEADVVIAHGGLSPHLASRIRHERLFMMELKGNSVRSMHLPCETVPLSFFAGKKVHAVAGIGRPERFFNQLRAAGIEVIPHPFPDHHRFTKGDLLFASDEITIMTSKDAVKCQPFASPDTWEFPVQAHIEKGALTRILEKLNGSKTA